MPLVNHSIDRIHKKRGSVMFAFIITFVGVIFLTITLLQTLAKRASNVSDQLIEDYVLAQTKLLAKDYIGAYLSYEMQSASPNLSADIEDPVRTIIGNYFNITNYSQSSDFTGISALLDHGTLNQLDYRYLNSPLGGLPYFETTFDYFIEGSAIVNSVSDEYTAIELQYAVRNSPVTRIPFMSSRQFNANLNTTVTVQGLTWFPKGYTSTNATESRVLTDTLFVPELPIAANNPDSVTSLSTVVDKRAAALYGADAYRLVETNIDYTVTDQYLSSAILYRFDGFDLYDEVQTEPLQTTNYPTGITISSDYGNMRRLIVDLRTLSANPTKLYFDCTTPSAKDRGIVVVGDQGTPQDTSKSIATNGSVRLVGSNSTNVLIGSGYGGIFIDPVAPGTTVYPTSIAWYGALFCPVRPELVYYTLPNGAGLVSTETGWETATDGVQFQGTGNLSKGTGDSGGYYDLGSSGRNFATIRASFDYQSGNGGAEYGFCGSGAGYSASAWTDRRTLYVRVNNGSVVVCTRDENATETVLHTFSGTGANGSIVMTYNRVGYLEVTVGTSTQSFVLDTDVIKEASYFGVDFQNNNGSARLSNLSFVSRPGGVGIYASNDLTFNLNGSLFVGDTLSSNLNAINIVENNNVLLDSLSPRVASLMW